jgi:hypothetical protein
MGRPVYSFEAGDEACQECLDLESTFSGDGGPPERPHDFCRCTVVTEWVGSALRNTRRETRVGKRYLGAPLGNVTRGKTTTLTNSVATTTGDQSSRANTTGITIGITATTSIAPGGVGGSVAVADTLAGTAADTTGVNSSTTTASGANTPIAFDNSVPGHVHTIYPVYQDRTTITTWSYKVTYADGSTSPDDGSGDLVTRTTHTDTFFVDYIQKNSAEAAGASSDDDDDLPDGDGDEGDDDDDDDDLPDGDED